MLEMLSRLDESESDESRQQAATFIRQRLEQIEEYRQALDGLDNYFNSDLTRLKDEIASGTVTDVETLRGRLELLRDLLPERLVQLRLQLLNVVQIGNRIGLGD